MSSRPAYFPTINSQRRIGFAEQAVERALLHFFVDQADADENRHHEPESRNRRKAEIDDDEPVDADGNLSHQNCRADHHQREEDQVVENAVAHRFAERIDGDDSRHRAHRAHHLDSVRRRFFRFTRRKKYSSSEGRTGCTERMRASQPRNCSSVGVKLALRKLRCDSERPFFAHAGELRRQALLLFQFEKEFPFPARPSKRFHPESQRLCNFPSTSTATRSHSISASERM